MLYRKRNGDSAARIPNNLYAGAMLDTVVHTTVYVAPAGAKLHGRLSSMRKWIKYSLPLWIIPAMILVCIVAMIDAAINIIEYFIEDDSE